MADHVYYHMERMLPELEDLHQRGLFSRAEIRDIVRRRRAFEFALERRSRLKEDYLRYIQYETQLESLRLLRRKALIRSQKKHKKKKEEEEEEEEEGGGDNKDKSNGGWKSSLSDRASAMRVMLIYERAVTRFKGDLQLWLRYLEYCCTHGTRRTQKVLTKALQLHPTVPGLWIYAAVWEFEHNANVTAARALMQRGLRMCPKSENLWLEYFRMELVYCQRMKSQAVLSQSKSKGLESELAESDDTSLAEELCYKLASTIFKNGIAAIPGNPSFLQKIIELLDTFEIGAAAKLENEILQRLAKDFPKDESCWDWHAKRQLQMSEKNSKISVDDAKKNAIKVYEDAIIANPSATMFEVYAKFLEGLVKLDSSFSQVVKASEDASDRDAENVANMLLSLYQRAESTGVLNSSLAEGYISLFLRWGKLEDARKLAKRLCEGDLKSCAKLWVIYISLELRKPLISSKETEEVAAMFKKIVNKIPVAEGRDLWNMALLNFCGDEVFGRHLLQLLEAVLGGGNGGHKVGDLACMVVDWTLHNQGIEKARHLYRRLLSLPGPSLELYKHCISLELRVAGVGCRQGPDYIRPLFKAALEMYDQEVGLWLEYCSWEMKAGEAEAASAIYWRARKTLHDPSLFIERYQLVF